MDNINDRLILLDTYVGEFWNKKDRRLSRMLNVMDNVEFWVMEDDEDFSKKIGELGRYLTDAEPEMIEEGGDLLISVMAYMSASKSIRLLNWLELNHPEVFQKILLMTSSHKMPKAAKLLGSRLRVLQRLDLISKVFNQQRSQKITQWLKAHMSQGATE